MNFSKTQILVVIATLAVIGVNIAANLVPFNGITTAEVSSIFQTYFVPAGYVFAIWGLIYILMLVFSFGYAIINKNDKTVIEEQIVPWYILSCVANIVWLLCWHYGYFLTTIVAMITLLFSLIQIFIVLRQHKATTWKEYSVLHLPFHVYLGWISVATIANISDVLWLFGFPLFGIAGPYWAAALMAVAGVLACIILITGQEFAFAAVIIWALIGIMVNFPQEQSMYAVGAITITVILTIALIDKLRTSKRAKTELSFLKQTLAEPAPESTPKKKVTAKKKSHKK